MKGFQDINFKISLSLKNGDPNAGLINMCPGRNIKKYANEYNSFLAVFI